MFENLNPGTCLQYLDTRLRKGGGRKVNSSSQSKEVYAVRKMFEEISSLPAWSNGRDIETIRSRIVSTTVKTHSSSTEALCVSWADVMTQLDRLDLERKARSMENKSGVSLNSAIQTGLQMQVQQPPDRPTPSQTTSLKTSTATEEPPRRNTTSICSVSRD